jgi:flagellar hook-basal body complex protein FliE
MSIGPISAAAMPGISAISGIGGTTGVDAATSTGATGSSFSNIGTDLIDSLQNQQDNADSLALQASTGGGNVGDVMIAAQQASMTTDMTVAVRNKAVDAFNQIMGMQF